MSLGVRHLTVLLEFKPVGLVAENFDGESAEDTAADDYQYFLFDPEVARQRGEVDDDDSEALYPSDSGDHEIFIRRNRVIWSTGSRVNKKFTLPSPVIMACWCHMGDRCEALLCVLHDGSLTIYNTSGDIASIPLPRTVKSIWPLPSGLLLQQSNEANSSAYVPLSLSSPLVNIRDISRPRRDMGYSPQHTFSLTSGLDYSDKVDGASISSHLILKDPMEEPHPIYIEERGKWHTMKEFDERTIWTSDVIPIMASYNKGKMQHSLWTTGVINSNLEAENSKLFGAVPAEALARKFSFQRLWQGKGAETASCEVYFSSNG